jgi:hypothetical protein
MDWLREHVTTYDGNPIGYMIGGGSEHGSIFKPRTVVDGGVGSTKIPQPNELVWHGTDTLKKFHGILKEGLRRKSHVGSQSSMYPIQLGYKKGSLGEQGVPYRLGDSMTTRVPTKPPERIHVDVSDLRKFRSNEESYDDLVEEAIKLEKKGIDPGDIWDPKYKKEGARARRLFQEMDESDEMLERFGSLDPGADIIKEVTRIGKEKRIPTYEYAVPDSGEEISRLVRRLAGASGVALGAEALSGVEAQAQQRSIERALRLAK